MRMLLRVSTLLLWIGSVAPAQASSAYCDAVRARASGEAALLIAPRVFGTGLRFPWPTEQPRTSRDYQLRIGISFSPLDAFRGVRLTDEGDADCEAHEARESVQRLLDQGTDGAELAAYEAQARVLESRQADWLALLDRAQRRFEARLITTLELDELHRKADALARKLSLAQGMVARFEARGAKRQIASLDRAASGYLDAEMKAEDSAVSVKNLDAWGLKLSGGLVPQPDGKVDWFASVEVSYSLGGPFGQGYENAYLRARRVELATARYELPARVQVLKADIDARISMSAHEFAILDRELSFLTSTLHALEGTDAVNSQQVHDDLVIERIGAESEHVYLQTLIASLTTMRGD